MKLNVERLNDQSVSLRDIRTIGNLCEMRNACWVFSDGEIAGLIAANAVFVGRRSPDDEILMAFFVSELVMPWSRMVVVHSVLVAECLGHDKGIFQVVLSEITGYAKKKGFDAALFPFQRNPECAKVTVGPGYELHQDGVNLVLKL